MLEEDVVNVLKFMASNGLATNESKTVLILLNMKGEESNTGIEINYHHYYYYATPEHLHETTKKQ